ncbi:DNA polymerase interacting tetratricopeptide repeat-containing, protein of 47 kDa-like [Daktulosphaira vitifoliae]|uniref:DNA polymerase interacting tetratricopeptide repeat-containing, protein of 47 kDa-like n=1 Tax=Daktulosphaira vitifoliae TaxID=58002 RepID=UPI0021AA5801|nr:DNA polymerase interacting tetratricopeptide repeat-containing, protein of 47 kDa-like [Daktulosphaira vitifoliae]
MDDYNKLIKTNNPMTDEERKELASRLDKDLDNFIDNLEQKPYKDGWDESNWREEMDKHPFFMTKPPDPTEEPSPLVEGLQNLRYDPDDNTSEELADKHKEDGNFNFKCKKYKFAIMCYQEGLRLEFENNQLRAQMYNNMSASHYFLKNYRSSLKAAQEALLLKPDYEKTIMRAINCCLYLKKYDECMEYCDKYLKQVPDDITVINIKKEALKSKKIMEKDLRKLMKIQKQQDTEKQNLLDELNKRNLVIFGGKSSSIKDLSVLDPKVPGLVQKVHLIDNRLVWPVTFLYPEYQTSDIVQEFHEDSLFYNHLLEIFSERPEWDVDGKYNADSVNIYFEVINKYNKTSVVKIDVHNCTLSEALTSLRCPIDNGMPVFIVFVAGQKCEKEFLKTAT